jgi:hypothetical protein
MSFRSSFPSLALPTGFGNRAGFGGAMGVLSEDVSLTGPGTYVEVEEGLVGSGLGPGAYGEVEEGVVGSRPNPESE